MALPADEVEQLFEYACEARQAECVGEYIPHVEYAPLAFYYGGIQGTYIRSRPNYVWLDVSFLDNNVSPWYHKGTALHEIVHLIDFQLMGVEDVCESESNAWRVENAWLVANGQHTLARWNWREDYPHCNLEQTNEPD